MTGREAISKSKKVTLKKRKAKDEKRCDPVLLRCTINTDESSRNAQHQQSESMSQLRRLEPQQKGTSYCKCNPEKERQFSCKCGEELNSFEWVWDNKGISLSTHLSHDRKEVFFHPGYSSGTAVVRGNKPFEKGMYYYWEIKILTPMYGTDVMIGVGSSKIDLTAPEIRFCSFLGSDQESYGYSYRGTIQHDGIGEQYGPPFVQGSIVGIFMDMFCGTIAFYMNRENLGVAFTSIQAEELYPMVCSTASQSGMRLIHSSSCKPSLQLLSLQSLSSSVDLLKKFYMIPGFKRFGRLYWWMLLPHYWHKQKGDHVEVQLPNLEETSVIEVNLALREEPCCSSRDQHSHQYIPLREPNSDEEKEDEEEEENYCYPDREYYKRLCIAAEYFSEQFGNV